MHPNFFFCCCFSCILRHFCYLFDILGCYYSVYPGPYETFRGSNFWCVGVFDLYYSVVPFVPFVTKRGSNFYLDRDCIFNRSSNFCPRMDKITSLY